MTNLAAPSSVAAQAQATFTTRQTSFDVPGSTVRPLNLRSYRPNRFVVRKGFPYTPPLWVNAETLVSSDGTYLAGDRDDPFGIDIPAHTRFIASESTWDDTAFVWTPAATNGINYFFDGAPGTSPVLDDVVYRIGKELYSMTALSFSPGQFLDASFNNGIDDAIQYSISMAVLLQSPPDVYGIMAGPSSNPKLELGVKGTDLTFAANGVASTAKEKTPVTQQDPLYVCLSVGTRSVTLYTGNGPSSIRSASVSAGAVPTQMQFTLGKNWAGASLGRMYVLEWGLWDYAVGPKTDTSISELFGAYSSVYGVSRG